MHMIGSAASEIFLISGLTRFMKIRRIARGQTSTLAIVQGEVRVSGCPDVHTMRAEAALQ